MFSSTFQVIKPWDIVRNVLNSTLGKWFFYISYVCRKHRADQMSISCPGHECSSWEERSYLMTCQTKKALKYPLIWYHRFSKKDTEAHFQCQQSRKERQLEKTNPTSSADSTSYQSWGFEKPQACYIPPSQGENEILTSVSLLL